MVRFARKVLSSLSAPGSEEILRDATLFNDLGVAYLAYELGRTAISTAPRGILPALRRNPENETTVDNFIVLNNLFSFGGMFSVPRKIAGAFPWFLPDLARLQLWEKALPFFWAHGERGKWPTTEAWQRG